LLQQHARGVKAEACMYLESSEVSTRAHPQNLKHPNAAKASHWSIMVSLSE